MAAKPKPTSTPPSTHTNAPPSATVAATTLAEPAAPALRVPKSAPLEAEHPEHPVGSAARGAQPVYPVEFHGYMGEDANGQPTKIRESTEGGLKWEVHDPRDIGPAGRAKPRREPAKHLTRHRRLFYEQAQAAVYAGLPGFKVCAPELHTPLKPTGPNVADHVTKTRAKPLTKG